MGLLIRILCLCAIWGIGALIFALLEEHGLGHWLSIIVLLGVILPWGLDLIQGNQVRLTRGQFGKGVCETLQEDAYTVVLFVNDKESSWSTEAIETFMSTNVKDGLAYIETQAKNYGQDIALPFGYYRENGIAKTVTIDQKLDDNTKIEEWTQIKNGLVLHNAARGLGYANAWHMLASDRKTTGMKQIAYLICVNKPGRSYAKSDQKEFLFYDAPEYAMLFASYPESVVPTNSAAVSHEFLHLFGAEDYYAEDGEREKRSQLAETLCPNDLMFLGDGNVWNRTIGGFTAYTIGWLDALPEEYKTLNWWR